MVAVKRKPKRRVHREWFRCVERGGRKSCPTCKAKIEPGEHIWSWGEYVRAKFRHIEDVCKNCWDALVVKLKDHAADCGCSFELEARGASRPTWLTMENVSDDKPLVCGSDLNGVRVSGEEVGQVVLEVAAESRNRDRVGTVG